MFLQMIVPGVDEYLAKGIQQLGDTLSLFFETDRKTQRAIRNMLLQNPKLVQDFADMETRAPGSLQKLGFGNVANLIHNVPPSIEVQREQRLGSGVLDAEEQELGFRLFKNNAIQTILDTDPTVSPLQAAAMFSDMLGIPRDRQLELEDYQTAVAQMNADNATRIIEAANRGQDVTRPIRDYAIAWRKGDLSPQVAETIYAHPLLGPQFDDMINILQHEENAELQRELVGLRSSAANISAVTRREIDFGRDIKYSIGEASRLLRERPEGVGLRFKPSEATRAIVGGTVGAAIPGIRNFLMDPEGVPLRSAISEINTTLFHLRSGTAVTASEKVRLEPYTPNIWDTADIVSQKLVGLDRFFDEYIARRQRVMSDPKISTRIDSLIDQWLAEGLSNEEIIQKRNEELTRILERQERGR